MGHCRENHFRGGALKLTPTSVYSSLSLALALLPSYVHVHARLLGRRESPGGGPAAGPALRPSPGSFPALPARRGVPAGAAAGPPGSAIAVSDNIEFLA